MIQQVVVLADGKRGLKPEKRQYESW